MNLPYVIDNRAHRLTDVLNDLLHNNDVRALDVATAYVNVGAFDLGQDGLDDLTSLRLLLGSEPGTAQDLGLRRSLRRDLEAAPFNAETLHRVEALIRFLRQETVAVRLYGQGFLHAKSYLFFADEDPGDRFIPVAGIVGSSNWTQAGLTTNQELNLTHKAIVDPDEAEDLDAQAAVEPLLGLPPAGSDPDAAVRRAIKSEVGARAILELSDWYDRCIGSPFDVLWVYNVFPEAGLEQLLGLVESLSRKIDTIDQAGMLDASVLGETAHPRNFNTLQRIAAEDETVLEEEEMRSDLASSEFLLATLQDVLAQGEIEPAALPDGIHSGRERAGMPSASAM